MAELCFAAPHVLHMPRAGSAQRDAAQVAAKRGRRDDRLVAAHRFEEVYEVASVSYRTWTVTPGLAKSKRFPVVMRLCRRVEATWRRETQRKVEGKPQGTHSMERAVFIPEWTGATRGVRISVTVEKLKHGPRLPPDAKALGRRFAGYGAGGGRSDAGSAAGGGWPRRGGKRKWRCGPNPVRRVILNNFFVLPGGGGDGWCRRHSSTMVTRHYVLWVQQCPRLCTVVSSTVWMTVRGGGRRCVGFGWAKQQVPSPWGENQFKLKFMQ